MSKTKKDKSENTDLTASQSGLIGNKMYGKKAKKDFIILHNDYRADIKEGDDLSDIPAMYFQNLKTENVI